MYIKVRVITKAKEEKMEQTKPDHFTICLREKAERNMANKRVLEIVAKYFKAQRVRIIHGHHLPIKLLSVDTEMI